jgi:hypothetical protein
MPHDSQWHSLPGTRQGRANMQKRCMLRCVERFRDSFPVVLKIFPKHPEIVASRSQIFLLLSFSQMSVSYFSLMKPWKPEQKAPLAMRFRPFQKWLLGRGHYCPGFKDGACGYFLSLSWIYWISFPASSKSDFVTHAPFLCIPRCHPLLPWAQTHSSAVWIEAVFWLQSQASWVQVLGYLISLNLNFFPCKIWLPKNSCDD